MTTVTITEAPLAIEDLLAVTGGARVELDAGTRARIAAGRALVDRALADGEAVYGLTTQVGHGKDTRLTEEEIQGEQRFLVVSHSGGIGPPLPAAIVRDGEDAAHERRGAQRNRRKNARTSPTRRSGTSMAAK
jgi:histidine ammonia-lyase